MIVTTVSVQVKPEHVENFIAATLDNHRNSIQEPGNLRFDVLRSRKDPCRFTLYEAYASDADAEAHKKTAHYLRWRTAVEPWMASPREGLPHDVVAPTDVKLWGR